MVVVPIVALAVVAVALAAVAVAVVADVRGRDEFEVHNSLSTNLENPQIKPS
jgi:hypothetical protein